MEEPPERATAERLVALARTDWKYSDLYLRFAEDALAAVCPHEKYLQLLDQRDCLPRLAADLRRAIQCGNWRDAERLASEGSDLRVRVQEDGALLSLASQVYGRRSLEPNATALALSGVLAQPADALAREIKRITLDLESLSECHGEFFARRALELRRLAVGSAPEPAPTIDPSDLREAALAAADEGDFGKALQVARDAVKSRQDRRGRVRAPVPEPGWVARLAAPMPAGGVARARTLGLEPAELTREDACNAYLSCCCADQVTLPSQPLSEGRREPEVCTCGHACPPEIGVELRRSLDVLMRHPFLTSCGARYLPWYGPEHLLVEVFSEDDPDAPTPFLDLLSLGCRRGVTRLDIEHALLSHGPAVCDRLGLDPVTYRVTCIPFDAYQRLAPRYAWGGQQLWTHFDGYQLTKELNLQALVGGDVRYGGPGDLCAVGRAYDSEHVTARFAIVRRDRLETRVSTSVPVGER